MYCTKEKAISLYYSNDQVICLVPCPRFDKVVLDKFGMPAKVSYPTGNCYRPVSYYPDLKGLNKHDYNFWQVDLVVYVLGDGTWLAADKATCAKATEGRNNASSTGEKCLVHLVSDLVLLDSLPIKTAECELKPFVF